VGRGRRRARKQNKGKGGEEKGGATRTSAILSSSSSSSFILRNPSACELSPADPPGFYRTGQDDLHTQNNTLIQAQTKPSCSQLSIQRDLTCPTCTSFSTHQPVTNDPISIASQLPPANSLTFDEGPIAKSDHLPARLPHTLLVFLGSASASSFIFPFAVARRAPLSPSSGMTR
jgi:hypothetical protein